jgi:tetratricopeptide (TPR) repeat protein
MQEAVGHWEQAVRIDPDYAEAHCNLGVALAKAGRIPEGIEHLRQALRINPDYVRARDALAQLQARQ